MAHGGNVRRLTEEAGVPVLDCSASINPLGPPEWLRPVIGAHVSQLVHYPDPESTALVQAIVERHGVRSEEVVVGNGSSEILSLLPSAVDARRVVVPLPAYAEYRRAAELAGIEVVGADGDFPIDEGDLVCIGQPANPTGRTTPPEELRAMALGHPRATFLIDEAFADFVEGLDRMTRARPANVIVLCSLTKFYAIPGLRLGFGVGDPALVGRLRSRIPPWSVNTLAQAVGVEALRDLGYAERTRRAVAEERGRLFDRLSAIPGLRPSPGEANFLLVRSEIDARELARRTLRRGVAIRTGFEGLDAHWFRVAVRTAEENERLCDALREALEQPARVRRHRFPAVMFCGTSSNAGKSVLTAALCRILLQDGYRVAPFKSQNMSLNSFVTRDGGEMGRAQVVQAQACRLEPDVRMNPILLKPNSDTGAQVIVNGRPVGNMDVAAYIRYKPEAFEAARAAYASLAAEHDVIVLEGAGSPAEVNLKGHDIVNLRMARHAGAPVLLVGDIDRGGVFASFVGTMEVLAEWERERVAGFVINRFRGRVDLLDDALESTRRHTGRPVLGVIPYLPDLGLPEEDSVSFKSRRPGAPETDGLEIAVVDLPHISNFTDFDALEREPEVRLRVARSPADLVRPDAVVIPGSKNVAGDLAWLQDCGLAARIRALAEEGTSEVVGICGGLQMLGERISDPHHVESQDGDALALGLLPIRTELSREKTLRAVVATHAASGLPLRGYEIHHGETVGVDVPASVVRDDGAVIGFRCPRRRLWGTYLHGLFDADEFRWWFIDRLRKRRGWAPQANGRLPYGLEPAFERLAHVVRERLDVPVIYRMMGLR